jgi:hypothetical protein
MPTFCNFAFQPGLKTHLGTRNNAARDNMSKDIPIIWSDPFASPIVPGKQSQGQPTESGGNNFGRMPGKQQTRRVPFKTRFRARDTPPPWSHLWPQTTAFFTASHWGYLFYSTALTASEKCQPDDDDAQIPETPKVCRVECLSSISIFPN